MAGVAVKPLTVGFHETPFLSKLNQENKLGFWFQLDSQARQQAGEPWGPSDPQALNRYSYVLNNPLKYTDPSGHVFAPPQVDISGWPQWAQQAVRATCVVAGCSVNSSGIVTTTELGIGPAVAGVGGGFSHAWIKRSLFSKLKSLVGEADFNKFIAALKKGIVPPTGHSGIKVLKDPIGKYTHELKIGGSAQRILGYIDENGVLVFDEFRRGGMH
jgi:hypothetical protein